MAGRKRGDILMESIALALAVAGILFLAAKFRNATSSPWWLTSLAILAGWYLADVITATAHWGMDTWGSERTPLIGRIFIRNFRIHHTDQLEMTRHDFLETNGNNALASLMFMLPVLFFIPDSQAILALIITALFGILVTNQIHQWAHRAARPTIATFLQRARIILPRAIHGVHHAGDHTFGYGITNGWSHALLDRIGFFRILESIITFFTGVPPRKA